jgi:hypothetical protein
MKVLSSAVAFLVFSVALSEASDRGLKGKTKLADDMLKGGEKSKKGGEKSKKGGEKLYKGTKKSVYPVQLGPRPYFVVDSMDESPLKEKLSTCAKEIREFEKSDWSIGHRGAALQVSCFSLLPFSVSSFSF